MTVARPALGKFNSVSVHSALKQRGKDGFIKTDFLLAIADGYRRHSCVQRLATSGQPGTNWALRSIEITLIAAPGSEALRDHELLGVRTSANVLSGPVL